MNSFRMNQKISGSCISLKIIRCTIWGVLICCLLLSRCSKRAEDVSQIYFSYIPVLCYHHINPSASLKNNIINTVPADFEEQIKFLNTSGYKSILSADAPVILGPADRNILGDDAKPIIITFDDGYRSVYDYAFPIMKKYDYKGIIFLITAKITNHKPGMYMNRDQVNELIKDGWEIGSHSLTHPKLNSIPLEKITEEIVDSKSVLEKEFGGRVVSFAYPYGIFNKRILKLVRENYEYAYTTIKGNNYGFNDLHLIERYLVLKTTEMSNFAMNLISKKLECSIDTDIFNNVLNVEVSLPQEVVGRRLQVFFNSRLVKDFSADKEDVLFTFNSFFEYNNFTIFLQDDAGEYYSITKMIHIYKSADIY